MGTRISPKEFVRGGAFRDLKRPWKRDLGLQANDVTPDDYSESDQSAACNISSRSFQQFEISSSRHIRKRSALSIHIQRLRAMAQWKAVSETMA
jgi:hypothetical protein